MSGGGFPIDLLLFGMIAAFLVLRLRSILGRRTGYERPPQTERQGGPVQVPGLGGLPPAADARVEPIRPPRPLPDPAGAVGVILTRMRTIDPSFDPAHFLGGAEAAFRMIVGAFATGDRVTLRNLLTDDTYRAFETAIAAREAAGETQQSEIRSIERAEIDQAALDGTRASITVRFVSDQVAQTLDRTGKPVSGTDAVTEITDLWTFDRDQAQPDPAWRLSAARSA